MQIAECKHCSAPLSSEALKNNEDVIVCEFCGTVHYMREDNIGFPKEAIQQKDKRDKPKKFILKQLADGLEIEYRWLGRQHTGLLFFTVIWNAFILFFTIVMSVGASSEGDFDGAIYFFMLPFYLVGGFMAYYVLAGFMNRTRVKVGEASLDTVHRPLPMLGAKDSSIDRRRIAQVYCKRRMAYESNDSPVYVFDVHFVEKGGEDHTLLKGLDAINKAIYIEQQIEGSYHINDLPVDGEYQARNW